MNATTRILLGFIILAAAAAAAWWFSGNYHRIGPEALEPLVLAGGTAALLAAAAFGFLQLVIGIKRLE